MKKIGFVDFYLSEWHANEYPAMIQRASAEMGEEFRVCYAWAEKNISPVDGRSTEDWCKEKGVTPCKTIDELCEKSDFILILAPDNPEKHFDYAEKVFPHKKPTYIDKTFAPDLETAKKIFALSETHHCPFFSTSSLRYAKELTELKNAKDPIIMGNGKVFFEYIIHTAEMASILLNSPAKEVKTECMGIRHICRIKAESGNEALILQSPGLGFAIAGTRTDGKNKMYPITSEFFYHLIQEVLAFFQSGILPVTKDETLEVMRLREAVLLAEKTEETWISVPK